MMLSKSMCETRKKAVWVTGMCLTLLLLPGAAVYAQTVPNVLGEWIVVSGTETETCPGEGEFIEPLPAGELVFDITSQNGSSFSGNFTDMFKEQSFTITETGNFSGTVMANGMFTGMSTYEAIANPGNILVYQGGSTFHGDVLGNTMNFVDDWVDTFDIEIGIDPPFCSGKNAGTASRTPMNPPNDVNGDGLADLIWQNSSTGQVVIWFLNVDGTVSASGFPGGAAAPWVLVNVADVNGDGLADLVWWNSSTGQVVVWFLNVDGTVSASGFPGGAPAPWEVN